VVYNVAGGGDSALYGIEPAGFYLRNGANQLAAALPLAVLAFPLAAAWQWLRAMPGRPGPRVLVAAAPVYLWLGALSMLPHKEERFLYVVYPLVRPAVWFAGHACLLSCWFGSTGIPPCRLVCGVCGRTDDHSIRAAAQMCMTASLALAALPDLAAAAARAVMPPRAARRAGQALASGLLLATTAVSLSRIAALRLHYGAPMRVYSALPQVGVTT